MIDVIEMQAFGAEPRPDRHAPRWRRVRDDLAGVAVVLLLAIALALVALSTQELPREIVPGSDDVTVSGDFPNISPSSHDSWGS